MGFPSVIGVTETWLSEETPSSVFECADKYDVFRCDRGSRGGGVALFARKCLKPRLLHSPDFGDLEIIAIQVKFRAQFVIFACFYRGSVTEVESLPKLNKAIEFLQSKGRPIVLMGDFNLPGVRWHDGDSPFADTEFCQDEFLDMFLSFGLKQVVNAPTRNTAILDLVFESEPN